MSVKVSALIWEIPMSMAQKLILIKLADHAKDDGSSVHPSQKTVADDCGCDTRTVQRVVKWACEEGLLVEMPGPGNRPRNYCFDMDAVRQRVRVTESQGDTESGSVRQRVAVSTTESRAINKNHQLTINESSLLKKSAGVTRDSSKKKPTFPKPVIDAWWEQFCEAYPKRQGDLCKAKAREKFGVLLKNGDNPEIIIAGAARYARACFEEQKVSTPFVKQMTTFLNNRTWEEEFGVPLKVVGGGREIDEGAELAEAFK